MPCVASRFSSTGRSRVTHKAVSSVASNCDHRDRSSGSVVASQMISSSAKSVLAALLLAPSSDEELRVSIQAFAAPNTAPVDCLLEPGWL